MPQWLVIGVSGVTCGGKTTLSHSLRDYFQSQRNIQLWNTPYVISDVQLLSQDDYFLPADDLRHIWIEKLNCINFEVLTSLDMKQMLSDITWTMKGRYLAADPINNIDYIKEMGISNNFEHYAPQTHHYQTHHYNQIINHHPTHIMRVSTHMPQARNNKINILILEGFMIFNQPELLTLCNLKFHFHLPYEKCYERRRKRTYDPPDVTGYFEMCVWPHYEKNFAAFRDRKDIVCLNGEINKERIFKYVLERIMSYFEERLDVACPPPHKLLGIPGCSNGQITKVCPMEQQ